MRLKVFMICVLLFTARYAGAANHPTLSLKLAALTPTVTGGAKVGVRVSAINESHHPVTYNNRNPYCDYLFTVRSSDGTSVAETDLKKQLNCGGDQLMITGRNIVITLKPGKSVYEDLPLTDEYDLSKPGQYSIKVERTFPGIGHFSSNVITVAVTP